MEKFRWSKVPLATTPWRGQVIPDALPILIRWAQEGEPHTYKNLSEELYQIFGHKQKHRKDLYGAVAGGVAQAIQWLSEQWGEPIPPLHTIVVNNKSKFPGKGAIEIAPAYFAGKKLRTESDRRAHLQEAMEEVFTYPKWKKVARALGASLLSPATGALEDEKANDPIPLPKIPKGGKPESKEHKALKKWVANNPRQFLAFGSYRQGKNEWLLSSGDRLDAHFDNGKQRLAIEVKTSKCTEDELQRGVYQAVKYRAIVRAEQKALRHVPNGEAVLVCTRAPKAKTRVLIKRLQVYFQQVPVAAEQA